MDSKLDIIRQTIESGGKIIKFKRNNRRIGKIILKAEDDRKKIIGLFGSELNDAAEFYYEWFENKRI